MASLGMGPFAATGSGGLPLQGNGPGVPPSPGPITAYLPPNVELQVSPETLIALAESTETLHPPITGTLYPTATISDEPRQTATVAAPTPAVVEVASARVSAQGGSLTEAEMRALLAEAGAPAEWVPDMLTIAWCESHYSPGAVGDSGNSLGLFQLWSGWARPGEDLFDPLTNARVAVRVREIRGRFGSTGGWTCATNNGIE